jgi:hypothetical protein
VKLADLERKYVIKLLKSVICEILLSRKHIVPCTFLQFLLLFYYIISYILCNVHVAKPIILLEVGSTMLIKQFIHREEIMWQKNVIFQQNTYYYFKKKNRIPIIVINMLKY